MAYGITVASLKERRENRQNENISGIKDVALAVPRGVEGAVQGVYQFADWATGDDILPDYDNRFLGRSETWYGGLAEGMTQFVAGFVPIAGQLGKAAQAGKWGSRLLRTGKGGKQVLNWKGYVAAEVATDFVAFRAQEERLSNLVQMFPQLQNPLTEFLAASQDDGEIEGRFKNSLEGLGISAIMAPVVAGIARSVKYARKGQLDKAKIQAKSTMEAYAKGEYYGQGIQDPQLRDDLGITHYDAMKDEDVIKIEEINSLAAVPEGAGNATVRSTLDALGERGSDDFVRGWSTAFRRLFKDDDEFLDTPIRTIASDLSEAQFSPFGTEEGGPVIHLMTNRKRRANGGIRKTQEFQETTLLHEMVHAAVGLKMPRELTSIGDNLVKGDEYLLEVDRWLFENGEHGAFDLVNAYRTALDNMPDEFTGLREFLNDAGGLVAANPSMKKNAEQWYGMTNLDEFVAEALTNRKFQTWLKGIEGEDNRTLWDRVMAFFKTVFGKDVEGSLLEDTIDGFGKMIKSTKERGGYLDYYDFGWKDNAMPRPTWKRNTMQAIKRSKRNVEEGLGTIRFKQDETRGGSFALEGVRNTLRKGNETQDIDVLLEAAEKHIASELDPSNKLTVKALDKAGLMQAVDTMSEAGGRNLDIIKSEITAAGDDANALRRIAARLHTVESLSKAQADNVWEAAKAIRDLGTEAGDSHSATFLGELKKLVELMNAGTKIRRGFGQGLRSTQFNRAKLSLTDGELKEVDIVGDYLKNNTHKKMKELVDAVLISHDPDDAVRSLLGIGKIARKAEPKGWMERAQNWFIQSLLSGPRTLTKNGLGNLAALTALNLETAVGGLMVNPALTHQVLKEFTHLNTWTEALRLFTKVWKNSDQLLDVGRSPLENVRQHDIPLLHDASPEGNMQAAVNWIGQNIINAPTKTLMAMDEVFKQMMFRQRATLELSMKAMKMGLKSPDDIAEYVTRGLDALLIDGERAWSNAGVIKHAHAKVKAADPELKLSPSQRGEMVERVIQDETSRRVATLKSFEDGGLGIDSLDDLNVLSANALEKSRYATFTNDAGKGAELVGGLVQTLPILKFVFPFVRTPVNLIKFSLDRATFGLTGGHKHILAAMPDVPVLKAHQAKLRDQLAHVDPVVRADAYGKMAVSTLTNTALISLIWANRDAITGGGPKDFNQKKALEATGWQPYSFKVGNKYVGYSGLDPFGMHFGVLVDIVDQMDEVETANTGVVETMMTAAMISMTRNITDKSYLAGLKTVTDALSEPDEKFGKLVQNLAGGFVPNILYQSQAVVGDTTIREARSIVDAMRKKLPSGADSLDPKRNLMGEAIIKEQIPFVGPFNPSNLSTRDNDIVFEELASLNHGFTNPSHILDGMIDLTSHLNKKGQTAHDRRMELMGEIKIGGNTMRQALTKVIRSGSYKKLSSFSEGGFQSPRVTAINRVMSRYRTVALKRAIDEFPELSKQYRQLKLAGKMAKQGAPASALESLLDF